MEGISTVLESGVRDRLLERMVMLGMSKFDTRIIDLGIPKHKLQSMWRNTTGDVPGIILEKMCKAFPELDAVYICSGIENGNDEERRKKEAVLEVCKELILNFKQRDDLMNRLISMLDLNKQ